jgi:hypothetical protein
MVETFDGEYVLYEDHLAVVAEKDREIERLNEQLAEKDNEISDLKMGDELYRKWVEDTQKWLMR